jgi:hypothetical protein
MIALLNVGRLLMVIWVIYAVILLFAPRYLHRPPHDLSASLQAIAAFAAGHLMDRAVGALRRRRAERAAAVPANAANS